MLLIKIPISEQLYTSIYRYTGCLANLQFSYIIKKLRTQIYIYYIVLSNPNWFVY